MTNHDTNLDEETPLLQGKAKQPLPWGQIGIALLCLIATEPISSGYIYPYINQLVGELGITGGDNRKIGYYAGIIESLFFVTQAFTTWQWSRLSDFIGRRPVMLIGMFGLSVSTIAFGLSRTFVTLIISRCLAGMLNGNVGVMKSILGDVTDDTNITRVFALVPVAWCIGSTIAPVYGGGLTKPQERWPHLFTSHFWAQYPYFLPSLVSAGFTLFTFTICAVFLKESLPAKTRKQAPSPSPTVEHSQETLVMDNAQPMPMLTLLKTYSVMLPIANYALLGLIDLGFYVLIPLFHSSPIAIGGLGLSPLIIGAARGGFGLVDGFSQALMTPRIIKRLGVKRTFQFAVLWIYPLVLFFPIMSAVVASQGKVGPIIWCLVFLQLACMVLMDMAYTVIFIFVTKASPNKESLGSVHGISQSFTSIARAIGPTLATSSFAASKQYNLLGGNFVYVVLAILATLLVSLSLRLPDLKEVDDDR